MSDIFISYEKADLPQAEMLARLLNARGWTTFWDRTIPAGSTWRKTIGLELDAARCVVVLWSKTSIDSRWVHEEAEEALIRGVLIPVSVENVKPPIGFRSIQAGNLTNWDGTETAPGFERLLSDIVRLIGSSSNPTEVKASQLADTARVPSRMEINTNSVSFQKNKSGPVWVAEVSSRHLLLLLGNCISVGVLGVGFAISYLYLGLWKTAALSVVVVALLTAIQVGMDNSKGLSRFFIQTDSEWAISHAIIFLPVWWFMFSERGIELDGTLMFSLIYLSSNYCSNYVARLKLQ